MSEEQAKASSQAETQQTPDNRGKNGVRKLLRGGVDPKVGEKTRFKKGQRVPGCGRPKKKLITALLEKKLQQRLPAEIRKQVKRTKSTTWGDLFVEGMIKEGAKGVVPAFDAVSDRVQGPVAVEISGPDGGPVAIEESIDSTDRLASLAERLRDRINKRRSAS